MGLDELQATLVLITCHDKNQCWVVLKFSLRTDRCHQR
jgi:hypothetical protein